MRCSDMGWQRYTMLCVIVQGFFTFKEGKTRHISSVYTSIC